MKKTYKGKQNTKKLGILDYRKYRYFLKNSDEISVNSDWLSVVFYADLQPFTSIVNLLDTDNSQEYYNPETGIYYTKFSTGLGFGISGYITYNQQPKKIFDYIKFYGNRRNLKAKGKLQLTGSYFRLSELGEIKENFISTIIKNNESDLEKSYITRYDYKIDFMQYENTKKKKLNITYDMFKFRRNQKKGRSFSSVSEVDENGKIIKEEFETIEHGSKTSGRVHIRLYNKLIEIDKKNKFEYFDYKQFSNVIRMEFQCETKFTSGFNFLEVYKLKNKLKNLLDEKYNGRIYEPVRHLDFDYWSEEHKKSYVVKSFEPLYKMFINGYNPTSGLILFMQNELEKQGKKLLDKEEIEEYKTLFEPILDMAISQMQGIFEKNEAKDLLEKMNKPISSEEYKEYLKKYKDLEENQEKDIIEL